MDGSSVSSRLVASVGGIVGGMRSKSVMSPQVSKQGSFYMLHSWCSQLPQSPRPCASVKRAGVACLASILMSKSLSMCVHEDASHALLTSVEPMECLPS